MRFFIAVEVPEENRKQIQSIQNKLQELIPSIHLTENSKLHLTIAFVGEQPAEFKDKLIKSLSEDIAGIPPFEVIPSYIDAFPKLHHPFTFWVGVSGEVDKLLKLREHIKDSLMNLQMDVDARRFVPHIAIGKVKDFIITPIQEKALETFFNLPLTPIKVESIKLFESVPNEGFHTHNTLAEIKLPA